VAVASGPVVEELLFPVNEPPLEVVPSPPLTHATAAIARIIIIKKMRGINRFIFLISILRTLNFLRLITTAEAYEGRIEFSCNRYD
jgi:hypothetical protein